MKHLAIALASALALVMSAPTAGRDRLDAAEASAHQVAPLVLPALAHPSPAARGTVLAELSPVAMSQVQGEGFWSWFKRFLRCRIIVHIWGGTEYRCDAPVYSTGTISANYETDRTDYYTEDETVTDTVAEDGSIIDSSTSSTGDVYQYSTETASGS